MVEGFRLARSAEGRHGFMRSSLGGFGGFRECESRVLSKRLVLLFSGLVRKPASLASGFDSCTKELNPALAFYIRCAAVPAMQRLLKAFQTRDPKQ